MAAVTTIASSGSAIRVDLVNHSRYCVKEGRNRPECPVCHGRPGNASTLIRTEIISAGGPVTFDTETGRLETNGAEVIAVIPRTKNPVVYRPNLKNSSEPSGVTAKISGSAVNVAATSGVAASPGIGFRNDSAQALAVDESKLTDTQRKWREQQKS